MIEKAFFGLRWGVITLYVKCKHFREFFASIGNFVKKPENQQYPRANLVYIVEDHSVVLNMGGTGIENIDFENTTEKRRSVR